MAFFQTLISRRYTMRILLFDPVLTLNFPDASPKSVVVVIILAGGFSFKFFPPFSENKHFLMDALL
jgi:hypothetical protein